jgi:DNA-binding transcriptional ArsR family regulator
VATDAQVFRALADHTRRRILHDLKDGELTAGEIASRFPMSPPSVSRHLSVLKAAGLISERREGNRIWYRVEQERLAACLGAFLSTVCPVDVVRRRHSSRRATA